jgi:uncharacterized membrane protein HdeD (DUF308 family)
MADEEKKPLFPSEISPRRSVENKPIQANDKKVENTDKVLLGLLPGILLILLGGVFLLSHYGYLEGEWWQYFLVGLGVVFLVESRIYYKASMSSRFKISRLIIGLLMVIGGLLFLFDPNQWWPLVLIGIGIFLCAQYLWRRRKK